MIVADTSVLIDFLVDRRTPQTARLGESLDAEVVVIGDLVLCEILMGCRDDLVARRVEDRLRAQFQIAAMVSPALAAQAATHYRRLRALGVTLRGTVDLLIATFCIAGGHVLLHSDRDFAPMQKHLGLRAL